MASSASDSDETSGTDNNLSDSESSASDSSEDRSASEESDAPQLQEQGNTCARSRCSSSNSSSSSRSSSSSCEESGETWEEHVRNHGSMHKCPRCVWMRCKPRWQQRLRYQDQTGCEGTWVEEQQNADKPWALGCKICRWAGRSGVWGETRARGRQCDISSLVRHQKLPAHKQAQASLLQKSVENLREVEAPDDRHDVPCFNLCYVAWKGALKGSSFVSYNQDVELTRSVSTSVPRSRDSRTVARKLVECFGAELRAQDTALLKHSTHISLTMDGRKGHLVVRARMALRALPPGTCLLGGSVHPPRGGEPPQGEVSPPGDEVPLRNVYGGHGIFIADRLLAFRRMSACATTGDVSDALVHALEEACGGDEHLWEEVRHKVFSFTPDGAADEQLAGRLSAMSFPNLRLVLRCSAHAVQGGIKAGWAADELSNHLTKSLVSEVAKYIRSSERFAARVSTKEANEAVAALSNFSFAPQRFSSKERPLSRFVVFSKAIIEALCIEVASPTSASRKAWAQKILRALDSSAWLTIAMLADLADDCTCFVRECDTQRLDPVEFWQRYKKFREKLKQEYILGQMWLRPDTYTSRMVGFLADTRVFQFGKEVTVLRKPDQHASRLCMAHVANVAEGILTYLKGEFPDFCAQSHFVCFSLSTEATPGVLRGLLSIMGWETSKIERCVQQYSAVFQQVVSCKRRQGQVTDAACWHKVVGETTTHEELKEVVALMMSTLVTETECERAFAQERQQFDHRPRLSAEMRFAGLKVMVDGPPLSSLQEAGVPVSDFFPSIQRRYAERFYHPFVVRRSVVARRSVVVDVVRASLISVMMVLVLQFVRSSFVVRNSWP